MRVVCAKPINERIKEAVIEARRDGRSIEKIVLTEREAEELARLLPLYRVGGLSADRFMGVRLEIEE